MFSIARRLAMVLAVYSAGARADPNPGIIPRPAHVTATAQAAVLVADGALVATTAGDRDAGEIAAYLVDLARRGGGPRLARADASEAGLATIRLVRRAGFTREGYAVDVGGERITVAASTRAGLLYGAVSVWQMTTAQPGGPVRLAAMHIEDSPRFAWRGLMLDSARHFQSPAEIVRTLDWMAWHKLNRLQWHLTDDQGWRLQIARYPKLTSIGAWRTTPPAAGLTAGRYGGFYTPADVRRLVTLAAARGITIVPEIEMPGHATAAIRAYPQVGLTTVTAANSGDWGVFPSIYNVDDRTFAFLDGVLDEVMALFPGRDIAIGGDEAVHKLWHASPAVQARMKTLGLADENALQGWFVRRIGAYLNAHGRRLVGWDDILSDGKLPVGDVVLSWHGADGAIAAARSGHDVVMATAPTLYFDNRQSTALSDPPGRGLVARLRDVYAYDPGHPPHSGASAPLTPAEAAHIIGVQAAIWTEHIATDARVEAMALPRAAALAEIGWTAEDRRDWPDFVQRLPAQLARYRALGLNVDEGALVVQAAVSPGGARATVRLRTQLGLGDIRYTIDGTAPSPVSRLYAGPISRGLPVRLRAASFVGARRLSPELDLPLDSISATRRVSRQLELCAEKLPLDLEGRATTGGPAPIYHVDIKNACWLYRATRLDGIGHIAAGVAALPFNYQLGDEVNDIVLRPPATPVGELVIRRDGCDGPLLATLPLAGAARDGSEARLGTAIPPQSGVHDLCLVFAQRTPNPLWALGWIELRP